MSILLSLVGLVALAGSMLVAAAAGRWAVVRALGVRGVPFPFGASARWCWATTSRMPQVLGIAGAVAATYLAAGAFMAAGTWASGVDHPDATSMRVHVEPGGPAANAGVQDGDRIDAVDGDPVTSWDELRRAVATHRGILDVTLTRGGATLHVPVIPDAKGRIQVVQPVDHEPASAGACARALFVGPGEVLYGFVKAFVTMVIGRERAQVMGPVGIVKESATQEQRGTLLAFLGVFGSYILPVYALVILFTGPGRRKTPPARGARREPAPYR